MTRKQRRDSKLITYNGKTQTIRDWAEELGVTVKTVKQRIREHRPPNEIFSQDRRVSDDYGKDKRKYFRKLEREAEERRKLNGEDIEF